MNKTFTQQDINNATVGFKKFAEAMKYVCVAMRKLSLELPKTEYSKQRMSVVRLLQRSSSN